MKARLFLKMRIKVQMSAVSGICIFCRTKLIIFAVVLTNMAGRAVYNIFLQDKCMQKNLCRINSRAHGIGAWEP